MKKSLKVIAKKTLLRCSSLPLFFSCPPAILNPDRLPEVRVENGLENLGTDIHAAIQHTIETGEVDLRKIERTHDANNVDRAKFLFAQGLRVVQDAKHDMKNPQFEVEVSFETEKHDVSGHVDVLDLLEDGAYIIDFKTGRTRDDHLHQMAGYAVGAWTRMGRPESFTVRVACVYLESYPTEPPTVYTFTSGDLRAWIKELDSLDAKRYTVNRRCVFCPLKPKCKVFQAYLTAAVATVAKLANIPEGKAASSIRDLSADTRSKLNIALKVADQAVKDVRAVIKEEALATGDIDMGNGNTYSIKLRKSRSLVTSRALSVVKKYVTPQALLNAMTLSLPALTAAAVGRVKGPNKALVREQFEKSLTAVGAIVETEAPYLETINAKGPKWPKKKSKP